MCLSSLLFFCSFSMIIPELPSYLEGLGGADYKGWIIGLFAMTAAFSRPVSGKLADRVGRVPVIVFGTVVCMVCGGLYPFVLSVPGFLLLRMVHGMSTGFTPTGTSSYVADIAPANRRGEALGIQTLCANVGTAYGPALGSMLTNEYGINTLFYTSSGFSMLSILVLLGLKETLQDKEKFSPKMLNIHRDEVVERRVLLPGLVLVMMVFSFGLNLTIIPDFSDHLGLENKGIFFTYLTIASICVRFFAGKASDIWGREVVLMAAASTLILAMVYISQADTKVDLLIGACIFGFAHGIAGPTVFAWTIDLARPGKLGRAIATTFIALEVGIFMGAFISGWMYGNEVERFGETFLLGASMAGIGLIILVFDHFVGGNRNRFALREEV